MNLGEDSVSESPVIMVIERLADWEDGVKGDAYGDDGLEVMEMIRMMQMVRIRKNVCMIEDYKDGDVQWSRIMWGLCGWRWSIWWSRCSW